MAPVTNLLVVQQAISELAANLLRLEEAKRTTVLRKYATGMQKISLQKNHLYVPLLEQVTYKKTPGDELLLRPTCRLRVDRNKETSRSQEPRLCTL